MRRVSELAGVDPTVAAVLRQSSGCAGFRTSLVKMVAPWIAATSLHDIAKDTAPAVVVEVRPRAFG